MKQIFVFSLCLCLLFSTGCSTSHSVFSNYRAIEELKLVHTMGFDVHPDGLELSVCGGESSGDGEDKQGLIRLSCSGVNIADCLAKLQRFSAQYELYYAHTRYILVGEEYAAQGLGDIFQYLESSHQLRSDLPLFVVKGGTAKPLVLESGGKDEGINHVLDAVLRDCERQGSGYPFTCGDIGSFSGEYGSALACALTATETKDADPSAEDKELTPVACGYAVLDLGRLTGFLSPEGARAVNFILGEWGSQPITVIVQGEPVSVTVKKAELSLLPDFGDGGSITALHTQLLLTAELAETEQDAPMEPKVIEAALSEQVRQWLGDVTMTMRSTQCDFLGFGPRIAIEYLKAFTNAPVAWRDRLATLPIDSTVVCTLHRPEYKNPVQEGSH